MTNGNARAVPTRFRRRHGHADTAGWEVEPLNSDWSGKADVTFAGGRFR